MNRARFIRFRASPTALAAFGMTVRGSGVIIGAAARGQATAIDLLRAGPTRAVVLGSLNLARTIVFRALGLGARVLVSSRRPQPWTALAQAAAVDSPQLDVPPDGRCEVAAASEFSPLLVVHDNGSGSASARMGPAPWRTSLHLFDALQPSAQHIVTAADLVIVQQRDIHQSRLIGQLLQLPGRVVHQLAALGPFQVVLLSRSGCQLVNLVSTPTERQVFEMLN